MASYSLRIKRSAAKEIATLETLKDRRRIVARIRKLADEPRPSGHQKLSGVEGIYRVRQGDYRIVYSVDVYGVDEETLEVVVIKVGHRKGVYRRRS